MHRFHVSDVYRFLCASKLWVCISYNGTHIDRIELLNFFAIYVLLFSFRNKVVLCASEQEDLREKNIGDWRQ